MKGVILGYDLSNATGLILGEDQNRYSFDHRQWRSPRQQPAAGTQVDFLASGNSAEDVYATAAAAAAFSGDFSNVLQGFTFRPQLAFAALMLLGCTQPLVTLPPQAAIAGALLDTSLFGLHKLIGLALAGIQLGQGNAPPGADLLLRYHYLAYVIPILAGWVAVSEMRNRESVGASRGLMLATGAFPFAFLIGSMVLASMIGGADLTRDMQQAEAAGFSMWGLGTIIIGAGAVLLLLSALAR